MAAAKAAAVERVLEREEAEEAARKALTLSVGVRREGERSVLPGLKFFAWWIAFRASAIPPHSRAHP